MSKRVSNKRGKHAGSRCRHVRIGYFRQRNLRILSERRKVITENLMKREITEDEREQVIGSLAFIGQQIRQLVPKSLLRRHQAR